MSNLLERMRKSGHSKVDAQIMSETDYGDPKYTTPLHQYMLNMLFSGYMTGPKAGIPGGIHILAGPSKSLKTIIGLNAVAAYLQQRPNAVCLFYDTEFGGGSAWEQLNIDLNRVVHIPVNSIEELRSDMIQRLEDLTKDDEVIIFMDSLGMLGTTKEMQDSKDEKATADMTRARMIKSWLRIVTGHLNQKQIPFILINHTIMAIGAMFPTENMTGGQGVELAANTVVFFGKSKLGGNQDDPNTTTYGHAGSLFKLKIHKSRILKEKTILPLPFRFGQDRPHKYAGIYELAEELKIIYSPSRGWRAIDIVDEETGEVIVHKFREAAARHPDGEKFEEIHELLMNKTNFEETVLKKFNLHHDDGEDFTQVDDADYGNE